MEDTNPQLFSLTPTPTPSNHFLYKAIFLSISLLLLPLFSSSSPGDFMINTASWGELLQLVFVGIAVSYGLFSTKRNHVPPPRDETHKQDDAQSYVARLFHSSSLFDDDDHDHDHDFEIKTPFPSSSSSLSLSLSSKEDNTTNKVWNSQYYRGEPIIVLANRESLSSSVIDDDDKKTPIVASSRLVSKVDRSNSRRKLTPQEKEKEEENNIGVLRSPIPWRSRSARNMEVNPTPALNIVVPPPPSVLETRSKSFQDYGSSSRKKISSPPIPPPPPPPPPPLPLNRINKKEFTRNYDLQNSRGTRRGASLSSSKSFRTPNQPQQQEDEDEDEDNYLSHDQEIESFIETRGGKFIIDEQKSTPNPKQQQQQDEKKIEITDTEESSTEDDEDDDDDDELRELASKSSNGNGNGNGNGGEIMGPDVDKKADEFIAKFREQIRLQRIASIRTSTQNYKNNNIY